MCCNKNNDECNCITEILKVINVLQTNACPDGCLASCDRPALGGGTNCVICNTRPIMLYTCGTGSVPFALPTTKTSDGITSSVFRVEKVDNNCCTFRVLANNPDETSLYPYVATDSIFTMDCDCLCAIRCLNDTYVECL